MTSVSFWRLPANLRRPGLLCVCVLSFVCLSERNIGDCLLIFSKIIPCILYSHFCSSFELQSTGVEVSDDVVALFNDFKLQQGEKLRFIIFSIENKKTIVIADKGERSKTFDDFCASLPDDDCRYGLVDLDFTTTDGRPTSKLVLITWNPDTASVRSKMLYSGSKEALKTALNGVGVHINATDRSELDFETSILPACQKFA